MMNPTNPKSDEMIGQPPPLDLAPASALASAHTPEATRCLRVAVVTLGCDKNTVDNEYLAGMLEGAGCEVVAAEDVLALSAGGGADAPNSDIVDAAVVTTCGFIASAKEQSIEAITDLARSKRETGSPRRLYVAGCLAQRQGAELMERIPEIDGLVGVGQFRELTRMILESDAKDAGGARDASDGDAGTTSDVSIASTTNGRTISLAPRPTVDIYEHLKRRPLGPASAHAFLKVSDGCNHGCTFCSIPAMKGKLRSVRPEILLAEARDLLARGVKEINLVAQDLSEYGRDLWPGGVDGGRTKQYRLPDLITELCALPGDFWVRCLYYYPGNVTDRFLEVIANEDKVVPYLEMPLQHLHPEVLRAMKRPFHEVKTFDSIARIRKAVPGIALRTTFIVGFPGETQAHFQFLLDGVRRLKLDRMGAFQYSVEEGTPAAAMPDQVNEKTKAQRWRMLMDRQARISEKVNRLRKGRTERVLVERYDEESGYWIARSAADAPEVDGRVYIEGGKALLNAGDFVQVKYQKALAYDMIAELKNSD